MLIEQNWKKQFDEGAKLVLVPSNESYFSILVAGLKKNNFSSEKSIYGLAGNGSTQDFCSFFVELGSLAPSKRCALNY